MTSRDQFEAFAAKRNAALGEARAGSRTLVTNSHWPTWEAAREDRAQLVERAEMAEIFIEQLATELGAGATRAEVVDRVAQWLDADHGQRLAEVRAEEGRAGYIAGVNDRACEYMDPQQVQTGADEYAARVRGGAV